MEKELIENNVEVVVADTQSENVATVETVETIETVEQVVEPKTTSRRRKKATDKVEEPTTTSNEEVVIEVEKPNNELDDLKKQLEALQLEKKQLEEERNTLNDTVTKLQEEVKITPQKLGKAIQEMGIHPLSTTRDNTKVMSIEQYNSMSDTQRREWQRTHRTEYLAMLHNTKLQ